MADHTTCCGHLSQVNTPSRAIYTYAKTLDFYSTTGLPQAQVPNSLVIDATDMSRQRGRADFDARSRFVFKRHS